MRFTRGDVPTECTTTSAISGWRQVAGLNANDAQKYGFVVGCIGIVCVAVLLRGMPTGSSAFSVLTILVCAVPLHELVHAFATPGWGLTDHTVIAIQRGRFLILPYSHFDGSLPMWRMVLCGLAPALLLTGFPLAVIMVANPGGALRADLGFLASFNIAISGGDLASTFWTSLRVPMRAIVQRKGWGPLMYTFERDSERSA